MFSGKLFRLISVFFLISLSFPALNQQADADIKAAIQAAIFDGLNTVDSFMRTNYWYYLNGSKRTSFNVSVQSTYLTYILIYEGVSGIYRVNCNIDKITWLPQINSLVRLPHNSNITTFLATNISITNLTNSSVDLTKSITYNLANITKNSNQNTSNSSILTPINGIVDPSKPKATNSSNSANTVQIIASNGVIAIPKPNPAPSLSKNNQN